MADERWLFITPTQMGVHAEKGSSSVVLGLDVSDPNLGLAPGLNIGMRMSPSEARSLAQVLVRKADEAEDGLPRA